MTNVRRKMVITWLRPMAVALVVAAALPAMDALAAPVDNVKAAELKRFETMVNGDLDALTKVLADDLTYTHSSGVFESKSEFLSSLRNGSLKFIKVEPSDPAVGGWGAAKSLQKVSLSGMSRAAQGIVNASAPRLYFLSAAANRAGRLSGLE